ncbi:glutamine transporter permease GlnP [Salmonella enterica subsp. enterica]|nr:glutamine transporter permease GlnP [Salmonella enterica subsp. enterica]
MQFDWSAIWPAIPLLLEGAKMTLWISVLGLAGGLVIGLAAGFARTFGGWFANHIALVFIEIIRGTPIVVQVMFIYFALPMAFNDLRIDPFSAAVVTIMINSGAYIAEITRGAVLSIHKGFREAGLALAFLAGKPSAMLFYRLLCAVCCRRWATSGSLASKTPRCLLLSA